MWPWIRFTPATSIFRAGNALQAFGQGIASYNFLDDRHRLFHSLAFNSLERKVPYLVDGLLNNDVVESTIHSTDMHSFEVV